MVLRPIRLMVLAGIVLCVAGCGARRADMLHFLREHEHKVSAIEYRIGIPDAVQISAPRILEIDGDGGPIQPDGKISLRLLGDVKVVGMTAREIAAKLEVLASRYYVNPKVRVTVSHNSKRYYVKGYAGEVVPKRYTGRDTLLDAVAGSASDFRSWTSRVRVIRPSRGDTPVRVIRVDVDRMLVKGDWSKNILLEPDDLVVIPPTVPAWLALRVREILYPIGPVFAMYAAPATFMYAGDYYSGDGTAAYGYGSGIQYQTTGLP